MKTTELLINVRPYSLNFCKLSLKQIDFRIDGYTHLAQG